MNLLKSIEEDEKKLAELEGEEIEQPKPEEESDEDSEPDDDGTEDGKAEGDESKPKEDEAKPDEKTDEDGEEKPVLKPDPKEEASAASFAKLRREKRELERQLADERAAKAKPVEDKKPAPKDDDPEPNKAESYEAWLEWRVRQTDKKLEAVQEWKETKDREDTKRKEEEESAKTLYDAVQAFENYQDEYRKTNSDYDNAAEFVRTKLTNSLLDLHPGMDKKQAGQIVARRLLTEASRLYNEGKDPAEGLYEMASSHWGYKKAEPVPEKEPEVKDTPKKPDLKAIDANRKRSASSLKGGGGDGSIPLTKEAAQKMSNGEFAKLTPEQLELLEAMDA